MYKVIASLSVSFLCVVSFAGCGANPEVDEDGLFPIEMLEPEALGDCAISLTCSDGTKVSCNGTNYQCSLTSNGVVCNGVTYSCPVPVPAAPCEFDGQWYQDGYVYGGGSTGVRCSSKLDGYCTGGPFAGMECVASGQCYAKCVNGTWENR